MPITATEEIDITDTDYAAAHTADGVWMGAVSGDAAQFQTADFRKCRTPVTLTATATLTIAALNNVVIANSASTIDLTVPPVADVAWPLGARIDVWRKGAGAVEILAGSGVTRRSAGSKYKANAQYSLITLTHVESDVWAISGDTST